LAQLKGRECFFLPIPACLLALALTVRTTRGFRGVVVAAVAILGCWQLLLRKSLSGAGMKLAAKGNDRTC